MLYVGRASNLRARVRSYWGDLRDRPHLRRMVPRIALIEHLVCGSEHEAAFVERGLLDADCPPFNRSEGTEVLAYLRYDDADGLAFAREAGTSGATFGPYLGSTAVRHAADALNFLYPVGHALGRTSRVGRELGRSRGLAAGDAVRLRRDLFATLDGDGAAVAAALERLAARRDAAASLLLFEGAARLTAQMAGLSWISQPVDHAAVARLVGVWRDGGALASPVHTDARADRAGDRGRRGHAAGDRPAADA